MAETSTAYIESLLSEAQKFDYDAEQKKYAERLSQLTEKPRRYNFFDLASDLGAGILSTPNTGTASLYTGLSAGFTKASDRMKASAEEDRKAKLQVGLQAAQLAMQNENNALNFVKEYALKNLDLMNKRGDLLTFEYKDEDGKVVQTTVRDNFANDDIINDLLDNKNAVEVKTPQSVVNIGGGETERDRLAIKKQYDQETEILEKYRAGQSSIQNIQEAQDIANRLGVDKFGAVESLTLYPRKLLSGLGLGDKTSEDILGDQILLSQISMGFTMDIVSRTKGAISNREMELFIQASPGLGSNYNGFMKQSNYLKRIAQRDVAFFQAYTEEADRLEDLQADGDLTSTQVRRKLNIFEGEWYDKTYYDESTQQFVTGDKKRDNLIFTEEESKELESIVDGKNESYVIPDGFDGEQFSKGYREGQDKASQQKSSYTTNKNTVDSELQELRQKIENDPVMSIEDKEKLLKKIDEQLKL
tara:strand:+ start:887 stop:2308 length:1422 start_codon:yes stop_codon:yes gene_type:complete